MTKTKETTKIKSKPDQTPQSASDREKTAIDDNAVQEALSAEDSAGAKSVLPGPPIPPDVQAELKNEKGYGKKATSGRRGPPSRNKEGAAAMIEPNDIREHMEVVGADGEHVGTVDHCEGPNVIKLTKTDPAAGGEHHYIPMAWVDHVDQRVHLAHSAENARSRWG